MAITQIVLRPLRKYIKSHLRELIRTAPGYHKPTGGRIGRRQIMHYAFEFAAKSDIDGGYYEFGCYQGASFIRAYQAYIHWIEQSELNGWKLRKHKMFAFDSFTGLPNLTTDDVLTDYSIFEEGQYTCNVTEFRNNLTEHGVDDTLVEVVAGYYKDTLTDNLRGSLSLRPPVVVHIDCDLYSSACHVLSFLTNLLQDGTLVLFDDYYCYRGNPNYGVQRAFHEWIEKTGFIATTYLNFSWAGKAFIISRME